MAQDSGGGSQEKIPKMMMQRLILLAILQRIMPTIIVTEYIHQLDGFQPDMLYRRILCQLLEMSSTSNTNVTYAEPPYEMTMT
jgi:hypothetical protein